MSLNADSIQQVFDNHQAEINILRFLVLALIDQCPNPSAVQERLRGCVEAAVANAPPDAPTETIVELRAHAEFYYKELSALKGHNSSGSS